MWAFLQDHVFPIFTTLWDWLHEKIPEGTATLSGVWNDTLKPALKAVWDFVDQYIIPIFKALVDVHIAVLKLALAGLTTTWNEVLLPALEAVWKFLNDSVKPILKDLAEGWLAGVTTASETLSGIWNDTLKPALDAVWKFIRDNVQPILDGLWAFIRDDLGPAIAWLADTQIAGLETMLDTLKGTLVWVKDRLNDMKDAASNASGIIDGLKGAAQGLYNWLKDHVFNFKINLPSLPDWAILGSPTPLEMGLRGIIDAMTELSRLELPGLRGTPTPGGPMAGATAAPMIQHIYQITNWSPEPESRMSLENLIATLELGHA